MWVRILTLLWKALDDLFAFCARRPLFRALLMEWRAGMESRSPSTITFPLFEIERSAGLCRFRAAVIQASIPGLTQMGMATVRMRRPLPQGRPGPICLSFAGWS
jgi:hypothetical protein